MTTVLGHAMFGCHCQRSDKHATCFTSLHAAIWT
jgi:hypothetical protein